METTVCRKTCKSQVIVVVVVVVGGGGGGGGGGAEYQNLQRFGDLLT